MFFQRVGMFLQSNCELFLTTLRDEQSAPTVRQSSEKLTDVTSSMDKSVVLKRLLLKYLLCAQLLVQNSIKFKKKISTKLLFTLNKE